MSESRRSATDEAANTDEELQGQVDAVADVLYGLTPDEFSPARDQYIRQAREQKNAALARELGKLRKPTQSAWLLNLLWRDQGPVMEQLFELAHELTQAQQQAAGSVLRELTQQRRHLENALLQQAVALARQKGVHVSDSVTREAQETLSAALALSEVADEIRSGRLTKATSYAGFGAAPSGASSQPRPAREPIDLAAIQRARAAQSSRPSKGAPGASAPGAAETDEETARRAEDEEAARRAREAREEEERRRAAERRLTEARAALSAAEAELARAERTLTTAEQRHADLRQQSDTLREQLRRVEASVDDAEREVAEARRAQRRAEAEHADTAEAVEQAERALR